MTKLFEYLFLSILFVACLTEVSSKPVGKFRSFLNPANFESIVILPEIAGDRPKLLTALHAVYMKSSQSSSLSISQFEKKLLEFTKITNSTTLKAVSPVKRYSIALVSFGNIGKGNINESLACYDLLFGVEQAYGWKVFAMYGGYELSLIDPKHASYRSTFGDLMNLIVDRFCVIVHVEPKGRRANAIVSPDQADMILANFNADTYSKLFEKSLAPFSSLLSPSDSMRVCDIRLGRFLKQFRVARVVVFSKQNSAALLSRCGSRLIQVNPSIEPVTVWPLSVWPPTVKQPPRALFDSYSVRDVIVIPDIHGDLDSFIKSLWLGYKAAVPYATVLLAEFNSKVLAMLKDPSTPGGYRVLPNVLFVQLGDLVDRGPATKECIELALLIPRIFPGCRTVLLAGNHELMNFHQQADAYINPKDALQGAARSALFTIESASIWTRLASKMLIAAIVDRTLFVHADLDLVWLTDNSNLVKTLFPVRDPINSLNRFAAYSFLQAPDMSHVFNEDNSPVWSRSLEDLPEAELCRVYFLKLKIALDIDRVIVGHNPQNSRKVRSRCGGKVLLADARISQWMSSDGTPNPMALHLQKARVRAHYLKDSLTITTDEL